MRGTKPVATVLSYFSIVNHLEPSAFSSHLTEVFKIVFTRIQNSKTVQLVKSFVIFLCTFAGKHGIVYVVDSMNKLQDGYANTWSSVHIP